MKKNETEEVLKKLTFEIRSIDKILFKSSIKKIEKEIDPRMLLTIDEAIIAKSELEEAIFWCQKWQENIKIWDSFLTDIDKELNEQEFVIKDLSKIENHSQFDEYFRITVSLLDFYVDDINNLGKKLIDELESDGLKDIDLSIDGEIVTFLSKNKNAIKNVCNWFYNKKVKPVIDNIKKL